MEAAKLYVAPRIGTRADIRLLDPGQQAAQARGNTLFKQLPADFSLTGFSVVSRAEDADFVIVPQAVKALTPVIRRYLEQAVKDAGGKPVIVFLTGDLCDRVAIGIPGTIVFNPSDYRHALQDNEVVFAPFVEDLGAEALPALRAKGGKPTVSFCGYASFPSWKTYAKYLLQNTVLDLAAFLTRRPVLAVYKRGIYFRLRALAALERDTRVETHFIRRSSFSGNRATIAGDPKQVRAQFVENIAESDFVLAPKGDANFSSRFYEALSLGRIPVLIDTDMVLPFEGVIPYDEFIVRVPFSDAGRAGDYICRFYDAHSDESFRQAQEKARAAYRQYLRFDSYFSRALPLLKAGGIEAVRRGA